LIEPHGGARRICDIALDVGFSDISHFNRLFRTRFGVSPRGARDAERLIAESRDPDPPGSSIGTGRRIADAPLKRKASAGGYHR
jgi:AraC-like DNA-binding protein